MNAVVIGGGIVGLSIALELARRGCEVRVFDAGEPARAASWAAAGMLAPLTEQLPDAAMQALCERSLRMYPEFVQNLREAGGVDPHLRLDGILSVAYDASSLSKLQTRAVQLRERGETVRECTRDETLAFEPALGAGVRGALLVQAEGQIDNRRLGRALIAACTAYGVRIETNVRGLAVQCDSRRFLGIRTAAGFTPSDVAINAAGAWAGTLEGVPAECAVPVRPVKGQMLALQLPAGFMRRTAWVPGAYLVPRADGRLLVGATVEEESDVHVTAGGIDALLHAAIAAAPSLRSFPVAETWAGLRPGTPDELPVLGATPRSGYFTATGHYRNGILLAPVTARLIADAVQNKPASDLARFGVVRFHANARSA